jgi:hypothetical protein
MKRQDEQRYCEYLSIGLFLYLSDDNYIYHSVCCEFVFLTLYLKDYVFVLQVTLSVRK